MEAAEDAARELEAAGEGSITLQNLAAAVDKMIATARAGGNLELVAEACRDMADSCRAAASKQLLLGVLRSRVRMELLPIVLGFTWQLLADAVQHLGTASARVPTEALLQCLHDSALILLCVQNASFSAQAGSAESPRLIGQCLILGLCRSNVLSNIAALLLAVRAQQRHLDRGEDHGEDGQIICGALQAVMTNVSRVTAAAYPTHAAQQEASSPVRHTGRQRGSQGSVFAVSLCCPVPCNSHRLPRLPLCAATMLCRELHAEGLQGACLGHPREPRDHCCVHANSFNGHNLA